MIQLRSFPTREMAETILQIFRSISNIPGLVLQRETAQDIFESTLARAVGPPVPPYDWWIAIDEPLTQEELQTILHGIDYAVALRLADELNSLVPSRFSSLVEHRPEGRGSYRRFDFDKLDTTVIRNR